MASPKLAGEKIDVASENAKGNLPAVMFGNPNLTKRGLIVLQEWWGLNDQIQEEAQTIAKDGGFVTIVPDLYRGKVTTDNEEAGHFMGNLDWKGAIADIQGCAKTLINRGCTKIGVTGFCMGGALSMAAAGLVPEITASAPFYGICGDDLCDVKTIEVPLQCHFGAKDAMVGFTGPEDQKKLLEKLEAGKVTHEVYTYDAGHAFTNHSGPNYNKEACETALRRMYEFFTKHLA